MNIMMSAGIGLIQHLETVRNTERNDSRRSQLTQIIEHLRRGHSLASALKLYPLLPVFDVPVIESGEKSGKLPHVLDILARNYSLSARAEKKIRDGLMLPLFTFSAAVFLPDFPRLFLGEITGTQYLLKNLTVVGIVIAIFFTIYHLFMRTYYDLELAKTRHKIFLYIPYLRGLTERMALEKFCSSLAIMLEAGLPLFDALNLAGKTSPEPKINLAAHRIIAEVKGGGNLPIAFKKESVFTDEVCNGISMGVESGKLPEFIGRSAQQIKIQIDGSIERISKALPVMIYWCAVLYAAWTILNIYIGNMVQLSIMLG